MPASRAWDPPTLRPPPAPRYLEELRRLGMAPEAAAEPRFCPASDSSSSERLVAPDAISPESGTSRWGGGTHAGERGGPVAAHPWAPAGGSFPGGSRDSDPGGGTSGTGERGGGRRGR